MSSQQCAALCIACLGLGCVLGLLLAMTVAQPF